MNTLTLNKYKNQLQTPVLFVTFRRPDTTKKVFETIRQAQPKKLYIAQNFPSNNSAEEFRKWDEVRAIIENIDWDCEICRLYREQYLDVKTSISTSIDWFFEKEEMGIILEDDCLPHPDFFTFCETLLDRYAQDERVWVVTGDNFQNGQFRGDASYYFSRYNHVWGWATWRRAWSKRDMRATFWLEWKESPEWKAWLQDKVERKYWKRIFDRVYRNEIDTWDYQWTACVWFNRGLTATPNVNLISNIGFGDDATHTFINKSVTGSDVATGPLGKITHPHDISSNKEADSYVFDNHFEGFKYRLPLSLYYLPKRVFRRISKKFKARKTP